MRPIPFSPRTNSIALLFTVFGLIGSYGQDVQPRPKFRAVPAYPHELKKAQISGQVIVEFVVSTEGRVDSAKVINSTHDGFNEAALQAVRKWIFVPGSRDGFTASARMQAPINFNLSGNKSIDPQLDQSQHSKVATIVNRITKTTEGALSPFAVLSKEQESTLPKEMKYDSPPDHRFGTNGVYPYGALLENRREAVSGQVMISASGFPEAIEWDSAHANEELKGAATAIIDAAVFKPALLNNRPVATKMNFKIRFDPLTGDVRISDSAATILKKLRLEGRKAKFVSTKTLDQQLKTVTQRSTVFPLLGCPYETEGTAVIEFYIDEQGNTALPRVHKADHPGFGYAAVQAIAQWKFEPPLKEGKPVVVKVRVPVKFTR